MANKYNRTLKVILTLVISLAAWELACRVLRIPVFLIPPPSQVFFGIYQKPIFFAVHTWTSLHETVAGFLLALVVGIVCAAVIVVFPRLRDIVMPMLLVAQLVPKVAVAPLLLIWFGYGILPKVLVAFLVAFFPIVVNTASGLATVQPELLELGRSLEASAWQTFWKFRIPSALPQLFSGMKIAVTLAIIGAVIGEFVGGNSGLGYLIIVANQELNTPQAFAAIVLLSIMGIVLYGVIELTERVLIPWHTSSEDLEKIGTAA